MENKFEQMALQLYEQTRSGVEEDFENSFWELVDLVCLGLMQDTNQFYSYFLLHMKRAVKWDMESPSGVQFKGAQYVLYLNPFLFLSLTRRQMETTIKHEVHHILALHLIRAKTLKGEYSPLAINVAMDLVVNKYLDYLPPYAITLEYVKVHYGLELEPYQSFEYYVKRLQKEISQLEEVEEDKEDEIVFNPQKTHDLWLESDDIEEQTLEEFTEKIAQEAQKGIVPLYLEEMILGLQKSKGEVPWNLYLGRLMGTVESKLKKTITRRNRRQPERLDLRGNLRHHKAEVAVAIDMSGSMSDEVFEGALKEVLQMVKAYNHRLTVIECDDQIRRTYEVKNAKDLKARLPIRGGTKYSPVFEYANQKKINLLVYFTDGKGEQRLRVPPKGYHVLWVLVGKNQSLSLKEPYGMVKHLSRLEDKESDIQLMDTRREGYSMQNQEPIFKI